MTPLDQWFY